MTPYLNAPGTVQFFLARWEQECCGEKRIVGQTTTVQMLLDGQVVESNEPAGVISNPDGSVLVIGAVSREQNQDGVGSIVTVGALSFGVEDLLRYPKARCEGRLWETRHGPRPPVGSTAGTVRGMALRPDSPDSPSGFSERAIPFYNTDRMPLHEVDDHSWVVEFTLELATASAE